MPIHALLFDLDDTLLETHEAHQAAIRLSCELAAAHHPGWTPEALHTAFDRTYRTLEAGLESGELQYTAQFPFRLRTWQDTLSACGLSAELGEDLARVYLSERRKRYRLYEDVPAALDALSAEYQLVLVTNGIGDLQREKVEAVSLTRWFSRIVISGEVGAWKPDPRIFQHALREAGVTPESAVMIGDSLPRDVHGAAALGIRTVWMRRYPHLVPIEGIRPDHTMEAATGLSELFRQWDRPTGVPAGVAS